VAAETVGVSMLVLADNTGATVEDTGPATPASEEVTACWAEATSATVGETGAAAPATEEVAPLPVETTCATADDTGPAAPAAEPASAEVTGLTAEAT